MLRHEEPKPFLGKSLVKLPFGGADGEAAAWQRLSPSAWYRIRVAGSQKRVALSTTRPSASGPRSRTVVDVFPR